MYLKHSAPVGLRICAMKQFHPDEFHITRVHRYSVLILMLDGILRFYEDGSPVELRAGEYYIQRAGLLQEGIDLYGEENVGAPAVYYYIEFQGGEFCEEAKGLALRGTFDGKEMQPLILSCDAMCQEPHAFNPFFMNSHLYRILGALYEGNEQNDRSSELLRMVRSYIQSEYASISDVEMIAKKFGYHPDYLTKLFTQKYRKSLFQYLKQVRMDQALLLLQNTSQPLARIAEQVGYENYSSFYRSFVAAFHLSPAEVTKREGSAKKRT